MRWSSRQRLRRSTSGLTIARRQSARLRTSGGAIDADNGAYRLTDLPLQIISDWQRTAYQGRLTPRTQAYGLLRVILNAAVAEGLSTRTTASIGAERRRRATGRSSS